MYRKQLESLAPSIQFIMTLYLSPTITAEEIRKAHKAGVIGVKSYPRGVTTNSASGIESYKPYYDIFAAMQECDMVLNLHGEVPSDDATVSVWKGCQLGAALNDDDYPERMSALSMRKNNFYLT